MAVAAMNKRSKKQLAGCGWQLIIIPLVFALLYFGNDAPVANPGMAVHPLMVVGILGGGLWFIVQMVSGKGGGMLMLIAILVAAVLIALNGTGAMPVVDNPCPGDEVIVVIGGECKGMDADANRAWLERTLGVEP